MNQNGVEGAFLSRLREGVLLADGAMGTLLYERGASLESGFEQLNLNQKDVVQQAHLDYLLAGSAVIETNTYGANRMRLQRYGLEAEVWEINVWGVKVARSAREIAGESAWVAGAVGPLEVAVGSKGRSLRPDEVRALYREQMEALLAGGVDLFIIETMADPDHAAEAVRAAREIAKLPVVAEFAFWPDGSPETGAGRLSLAATGQRQFATVAGFTPEAVGARLNAVDSAAHPDVIGVNCGSGAAHLLKVLEPLQRTISFETCWAAMPNAGQPAYVDGRMVYMAGPEYIASTIDGLIERGVSLLGGCCGTTPRHITAMREWLDGRSGRGAGDGRPASPTTSGPVPEAGPVPDNGAAPPSDASMGHSTSASAGESPSGGASPGDSPGTPTGPSAGEAAGASARAPQEGQAVRVPTPTAAHLPAGASGRLDDVRAKGERSARALSLREKLNRQFAISVELDPPRGPGVKKYLQAASALRDAGVDAINIADSPMARVRMSAVAAAHLIQDRVGVEPMIHFTTRDRNLMAIQSDLLGAHALGIRNVIALTGDPPSLGNVARATPVYNIDSIGLVQTLSSLNAGTDVGGNPMGRPTDFTIACALSPNADDPQREADRFREKLAAGAHFVMTQPLYELDPLLRTLDAAGGCDRPILLGVMPLHSFKHAEYLHNEVPGISIPERMRRELRLAGDDGLRAGIEQATAIVQEARPWIAGVYVVLSFGKYEPICHFVRELRDLMQPDEHSAEG